ncbi:hypothetical protein [Nonomuraea sp. SYSU D8015]|nr:hypothetical protein [Nonomuraea sp. SYSU D8015]
MQAVLLYAATAGRFVIAFLTGERTTVIDAWGRPGIPATSTKCPY